MALDSRNHMKNRSFIRQFQKFLQIEAYSGVLLLFCTIVALFLANSPFQEPYICFLHLSYLGMSIHQWINDGLMTVFFLVIGLEIKREFIHGELSSRKKAALPIAGAIGGMTVPALIYTGINFRQNGAAGWGIPMATDIAFAIGILTLLGKKVPSSLKIFLTALAIVDDMGAILVIALFYTQNISWLFLGFGSFVLLILYGLNRFGISRGSAYLILGVLLWGAFLRSGIHPTIAGILLAWVMPSTIAKRLEYKLHPWVSFGIIPIFALANAGLPFRGGSLFHPISYGIIAGLVLGKQLGITFFSWATVKLDLAKLPEGISFQQIYGAACLGGIGFTMSLFIAHLAFDSNQLINTAKLGILLASVMSSLIGAAILKRFSI